jgi:3-hydroxyacyl-CoA dehydrogenase/enoyl-CoA hydratase/3-hydroxybutyryl-CoA epimerase/enoyl-CoA isomerase
MIFQGKSVSIELDNGIAHLIFDLEGEAINKLNDLTMDELKQASEILANNDEIKGLLIRSSKPYFIVGADVFEFTARNALGEKGVVEALCNINSILSAIEDLPYPSVTAINKLTLGGGLEVALSTDYRVADTGSKMGFPEIKLGIFPGYGGTVRAPRLIGLDNAIEWITSTKEYKAEAALAVGMVDAVVAPDQLIEASLDLLHKAIDGEFDYKSRRKQKTSPLQLDNIEMTMAFETAKGLVAQQAGPHYISPLIAVKSMEKGATLSRDEALRVESEAHGKLSQKEITGNLVRVFIGDMDLSKRTKDYVGDSAPISQAAVLGAGIMGGGIAYQSASTGTPILMKDIAQQGIDMGMAEATKLLTSQLKRGRIKPEKMAKTLSNISPTLSYDSIDNADIIVEAVVENPKVKKSVLSEVESLINEDTILTSNTSTIPITELATALKRPENFCGMHFFNPVHRMPLVEIIRGEKTSDETIARTVNYALAMRKKPVVVNDCPGFLVNRILTAYFAGFVTMINDGADFVTVDKAAEAFGWPMGPAYLSDVVGLDTSVHADSVMSAGFPDRMTRSFKSCFEVLYENNRYGQKTNKGFYLYETDKRGKPRKIFDPETVKLLAPHVNPPKEFSKEEIIDRLMVPLCLESIRCLEEGIAATAVDLDMALIYGAGFPPFRGGALRYVENIGLQEFCEKADKYAELGAMYKPSEKFRQLAADKGSLF